MGCDFILKLSLVVLACWLLLVSIYAKTELKHSEPESKRSLRTFVHPKRRGMLQTDDEKKSAYGQSEKGHSHSMHKSSSYQPIFWDGEVLKIANKMDMFIMYNGTRHFIPTWDAFLEAGYDGSEIQEVSFHDLKNIPIGEDFRAKSPMYRKTEYYQKGKLIADEKGIVEDCADFDFTGSKNEKSIVSDYIAFVHSIYPPSSFKNIHINLEHTIVTHEAAELDPAGKTPLIDGGGMYRVRLANKDNFNDAVLVADYSMPNIEHIQRSELFPELISKLVYVPPLLYRCGFNFYGKHMRPIDVLTTFYIPEIPRRKAFLDHMGSKVTNVNNVIGWKETRKLYLSTRILVNIHQTNYHHTFEEIRVLPALLNGVVVISERVPLQEAIPYHDYIIFGDLDDIPRLVEETMTNYEIVRNRIFGSLSKLPTIIHEMKETLLSTSSSRMKTLSRRKLDLHYSTPEFVKRLPRGVS